MVDPGSVRGQRERRRPMRSSAVVRELILEAAQFCFANSGFAATSTREIAARADVVESLVYKHFGSKAELFEQAVVAPFREAVDVFLTQWGPRSTEAHTGESTSRAYAESLYALVEDHADLLVALMRDRREERPLVPLLEELERVAAYELGSYGWRGVDTQVLVRLQFGMIAFNAAFEDDLYAPGPRRPDRERIIAEISAFLVHGTAHRPSPGS
jgi:AcrR family transcriptional regulator